MGIMTDDAVRSADEGATAAGADPTGSWLSATVTRHAGRTTWCAFVAALGFVVLAPIALFFARAFEDGAAPLRALPDVPDIG